MLLPILHSVSNVLIFMKRHVTEYTLRGRGKYAFHTMNGISKYTTYLGAICFSTGYAISPGNI